MISSKGKMTLGGMVLALALSALTATPAHAGLTTINPTTVQRTIDWSTQTVGFKAMESTSTSSIDTQSLFAASESSATTTSTTSIDALPQAPTPAEAPMPPAAISGSVMLILSVVAAKVMKRKLAI